MITMSFNLLCAGRGELEWQKRIPLVVRTIRNADPDTFGVQEAHIGWMKALRAAFPDYADVGVGRDNGKTKGEFSAVFYKKDRYQLLDSGSFWLSETPEKPGRGWDAACIRICSWAKLLDIRTEKTFIHMNTHLDHIGAIAMQKGAELICERASLFDKDAPVILTGDFNVTPDSVPCKTVLEGGFSDARDVAAETDKGITFHAYQPKDPDVHSVIDYIFVKNVECVNKFRVVTKKIDGTLPSDHYPVVAELNL